MWLGSCAHCSVGLIVKALRWSAWQKSVSLHVRHALRWFLQWKIIAFNITQIFKYIIVRKLGYLRTKNLAIGKSPMGLTLGDFNGFHIAGRTRFGSWHTAA